MPRRGDDSGVVRDFFRDCAAHGRVFTVSVVSMGACSHDDENLKVR